MVEENSSNSYNSATRRRGKPIRVLYRGNFSSVTGGDFYIFGPFLLMLSLLCSGFWLTDYWPIDDWLQDTANYSCVAANIGWLIDWLIIDGLMIDCRTWLTNVQLLAANIGWLIDWLIIHLLMIDCRAPTGAAGPARWHYQLQLCGRQCWLINWLTDYWPIDDWLQGTCWCCRPGWRTLPTTAVWPPTLID